MLCIWSFYNQSWRTSILFALVRQFTLRHKIYRVNLLSPIQIYGRCECLTWELLHTQTRARSWNLTCILICRFSTLFPFCSWHFSLSPSPCARCLSIIFIFVQLHFAPPSSSLPPIFCFLYFFTWEVSVCLFTPGSLHHLTLATVAVILAWSVFIKFANI